MLVVRHEVLPQRWVVRSGIRWLFGIGACALIISLAHGQATRDLSKVEVKTQKITDNFHVLDFGGQGSSVGVLTGQDGVLMIDAQFAPLGPKIEAAIKQLSSQPIRYVINTHVHGDHTGGNEYFARLGATIVAHQQVRASMMQRKPPVADAALPRIVYDSNLTLNINGQDIRLIAIPRAHTNGDTLVHFPGLDIIVVGDLFRPTPYPHIDLASGGTFQGNIDGLDTLIKLSGPDTRIIAGHGGPISDRATVITQRQLMLTVRDRVAALIAQGKSEQEVLAARVTEGLDPKVPQSDITVDRFVREVYADLKGDTKAAH